MKTPTQERETAAPATPPETHLYIVNIPITEAQWQGIADREAITRVLSPAILVVFWVAQEVRGVVSYESEPPTYRLELLVRLDADWAAELDCYPVEDEFTFKPVRLVGP